METLGRESKPLSSKKLREAMYRLEEERSDTIEKCSMRMMGPIFYQNS